MEYSDLIHDNMGMVQRVYLRYCGIGESLGLKEDLLNAGKYGIIKAKDSFNPEKGDWANHLYYHILYEMNIYLRDIGYRGENKIKFELDCRNQLIDNIHGSYDLEEFENSIAIREALSKLNERQYRIVIMNYCYGYSNSQIANIEGASLTTINTILYRARIKLRKYLKVDDFKM